MASGRGTIATAVKLALAPAQWRSGRSERILRPRGVAAHGCVDNRLREQPRHTSLKCPPPTSAKKGCFKNGPREPVAGGFRGQYVQWVRNCCPAIDRRRMLRARLKRTERGSVCWLAHIRGVPMRRLPSRHRHRHRLPVRLRHRRRATTLRDAWNGGRVRKGPKRVQLSKPLNVLCKN